MQCSSIFHCLNAGSLSPAGTKPEEEQFTVRARSLAVKCMFKKVTKHIPSQSSPSGLTLTLEI